MLHWSDQARARLIVTTTRPPPTPPFSPPPPPPRPLESHKIGGSESLRPGDPAATSGPFFVVAGGPNDIGSVNGAGASSVAVCGVSFVPAGGIVVVGVSFVPGIVVVGASFIPGIVVVGVSFVPAGIVVVGVSFVPAGIEIGGSCFVASSVAVFGVSFVPAVIETGGSCCVVVLVGGWDSRLTRRCCVRSVKAGGAIGGGGGDIAGGAISGGGGGIGSDLERTPAGGGCDGGCGMRVDAVALLRLRRRPRLLLQRLRLRLS